MFFCFSTVCFVKVAFVHIFLFYLPASLLSQLSLINELLEFHLRGGKTCAFDSIVIRSRNNSWQPAARIYRSSCNILPVDLLMFMFYRAYIKEIALYSVSSQQTIPNMVFVSCYCNYSEVRTSVPFIVKLKKYVTFQIPALYVIIWNFFKH